MKRKSASKQSAITGFFKPKSTAEGSSPAKLAKVSSEHVEIVEDALAEITTSTDCCSSNPIFGENIDVGTVIEYVRNTNVKLSDAEKLLILEKHWVPKKDEDFPYSMCNRGGGKMGKRYLKFNHLQSNDWLAVAKDCEESLQGAWCLLCVLFKTSDYGGGKGAGCCRGGGQLMGNFVRKPLKDFSDLTGKNGYLTKHKDSDFHKICKLRADEFLCRQKDKRKDIRNLLSEERRRQIEENRKMIAPIIDICMTMAKQNIAFRGHRDDGPINYDGADSNLNEGNFRAIMRLRLRGGDASLQHHLKTAPKNAQYTSKTVQNEILNSICKLIKEDLRADIDNSGVWTILADETQDRAKREQLVVAIRYCKENADGSVTMHEDPIAVLDLIADVKSNSQNHQHDEIKLSGAAIGQAILRCLDKLKVDKSKCVGQGFDGASAMASERVGTAAEIRKIIDNADYFHCMMHNLNLCVSISVNVRAIRHCMDVIKEGCSFFNYAKRHNYLKDKIKSSKIEKQTKKESLVKLCTTRFIERFVSVIVFKALLPFILKCLEDMEEWDSSETRKSARSLSASIRKPAFLVALVILEKISTVMMPISSMLQEIERDIVSALELIEDTKTALQKLREQETSFDFFAEACAVAKSIDISKSEMEFKPRFAKRSVYRTNTVGQDDSAAEYYRLTVLIPTVDSILSDLKLRFGPHQKKTLQLILLLPNKVKTTEWTQLISTVEKYSSFLDSESVVQGEFEMWREKWLNNSNASKYTNALSSINQCSKLIYPNIHTLLKVLCVLPVTTAEPERFFSKLERTLTSCRATMAEDRLEALLLIQCHRERTPDIERVIEHFAGDGGRRMELLLK